MLHFSVLQQQNFMNHLLSVKGDIDVAAGLKVLDEQEQNDLRIKCSGELESIFPFHKKDFDADFDFSKLKSPSDKAYHEVSNKIKGLDKEEFMILTDVGNPPNLEQHQEETKSMLNKAGIKVENVDLDLSNLISLKNALRDLVMKIDRSKDQNFLDKLKAQSNRDRTPKESIDKGYIRREKAGQNNSEFSEPDITSIPHFKFILNKISNSLKNDNFVDEIKKSKEELKSLKEDIKNNMPKKIDNSLFDTNEGWKRRQIINEQELNDFKEILEIAKEDPDFTVIVNDEQPDYSKYDHFQDIMKSAKSFEELHEIKNEIKGSGISKKTDKTESLLDKVKNLFKKD